MYSIALQDALRPTDSAFKTFYERSYRTWHRVCTAATTDCSLPSTCLKWEHLFPKHAFLPVDVRLDECDLVTAKSIWVSSQSACDLPTVKQTFQFHLSTGRPISTVLSENPEVFLPEWFGKDDRHVVVLIYAWAYALSARWVEIIPRASPITYTTNKARWGTHPLSSRDFKNNQDMFVSLGTVESHAARWWEAVLPHQRWRSHAPWSVSKECDGINIVLTGSQMNPGDDLQNTASFEEALNYIESYASLHNAHTQNRAALAAALLLPQATIDKRKIYFHAAKGFCREPKCATTPTPSPPNTQSLEQLDKLLTLSSNKFGMRAVLGSIFYTSGVAANLCGAWVQGALAVLKSKGAQDLHVLARMFMNRDAKISFLWLGGILTGAHKRFIENIVYLLGFNRIDLHAGAWTGTLQSFIQEPVSPVPINSKTISRADECRLMFLAQDRPRDHPPIYPYAPLGETDIVDADLEVQLHARCMTRHQLQLLSITWDCIDGQKVTQETGPIAVVPRDRINDDDQNEDNDIEVDFSYMNRDKDCSEGTTRNIFMWMREMDGFAVAERDIYRHEWVDFSDSDDESVGPEGDGRSTVALNMDAKMGRWMARGMIRRSDSM